jgi:hypothetical protein
MERLHFRCIERALSPLDSLVVHVAGKRRDFPGSGYFRINEQTDPLNGRSSAVQQVQATAFLAGPEKCDAATGVYGADAGKSRMGTFDGYETEKADA